MKKHTQFLVGLSLIFITSCNSNNETKSATASNEVVDLFQKFIKGTLKEDYEIMYELTYPETFRGYTKEDVIRDLKKGLHDKDYDIKVNDIRIDSVYSIIEHESNKYSIVKSSSNATFFMHYEGEDDPARLIKNFDRGCKRMKRSLGELNVDCNADKMSIEVRQKTKNYAIYDSKRGKWFILGNVTPTRLKRIIPQEVRSGFGEE